MKVWSKEKEIYAHIFFSFLGGNFLHLRWINALFDGSLDHDE